MGAHKTCAANNTVSWMLKNWDGFRCDFCSKTFTRKEHLLNHVRQHTGESPHRCNYCTKSFTRKVSPRKSHTCLDGSHQNLCSIAFVFHKIYSINLR